MLISIHDKTLKRVAFLDNDKPNTAHYYNDEWHRYLSQSTSTFDFTVPKVGTNNEALAYLNEENYVSFRYEKVDYLFNIMKVVENEETIEVSTENLNLELITEIDEPHKAQGAHNIAWYLDQNGITRLAEVKLGYNEIADRQRTLSWEGNSTKLERLSSIVKGFDAEHEFVTHLNRDGTLKDITINIYREHDKNNQGVGQRRDDITLYYRRDLSGVTKTVDKTEMYTGIRPLGNNNINISGISKKEYDDDGNLLFYTDKGSWDIYCPSMAEKYPAQFQSKNGDKWIVLTGWTYETDDPNVLYSQAVKKLKTCYQPAVTYEAESTLKLGIGDTVKIHDSGFNPPLLLEARVSEQIISFSDPTKNQNRYSNVTALSSGLSTSIQSRIEAIVSNMGLYIGQILTDNGTILGSSSEATILTARVLKNNKDATSDATITWYKDGVKLSTGTSVTVKGSDIISKKKGLYRFDAVDSSGGILCTAEITVTYSAINIDQVYPIGSIYISAVNTDPSTLFGGTWESISSSDSGFYWKRTA